MELDFEINNEQVELLHFLWNRKHSLDTIGISSKNVFDWSKQGLLLDPIKPKSRRKYSIVEFVWLKLVVGLREFGLSLEAIRNVRVTLLEVISFTDTIDIYMDEANEKDFINSIGKEKLYAIREEITKLKNEVSEKEFREISETMNLPEQRFMTTLLSYLVIESICSKRDFHLLINSKGDCLINDSQNHVPLAEEMNFFNQPYIKYPLQLLIGEFLQTENLITKEETLHYRLLSKKELELLELLKNDNLVSLTVRFDQNQQIKLIETEEDILVENAKGKITDFLMRNNFQEIVCKTQDGKITSLRRKTKHK